MWLKRRGNQALDSARARDLALHDDVYERQGARRQGHRRRARDFQEGRVYVQPRVRLPQPDLRLPSVELEERSIAFRLLERRLSLPHDPGALDLSSLQIVALKLRDRGSAELKLEGDDKGLRGVTAAGSGAAQDPKMVALSEVVELLNELLGAEELGRSQVESFIEALVANLAGNDDLRQQARVNTIQQFAESPDFDEAVVDAVADNQSAFKTVADFFYTDAPMRQMVMSRLAGLLYAEGRRIADAYRGVLAWAGEDHRSSTAARLDDRRGDVDVPRRGRGRRVVRRALTVGGGVVADRRRRPGLGGVGPPGRDAWRWNRLRLAMASG